MDFNALLKDFARLDKINRELADLEKPEVIEAKVKKLFPAAKWEARQEKINEELNNIFRDLL